MDVNLKRLKNAIKMCASIHIPDGRPNVFLLSLPRSGSTWVAELVATQPGFKWCLEPFNLRKPVENLAMLFLPFAALFLLLARFTPAGPVGRTGFDLALALHILLSISAYSLLSIAALQAVLLAVQEHQLRHHGGVRILNILPPLKVMEDVLFGLIGTGFFCLSLSLVSGLMFVHDLFAQHLVHKTVLSLLAWVIFAILLWGRWSRGWRGRKAIRWTLGGFVTLMLAYYGTKLVLELILQRV